MWCLLQPYSLPPSPQKKSTTLPKRSKKVFIGSCELFVSSKHTFVGMSENPIVRAQITLRFTCSLSMFFSQMQPTPSQDVQKSEGQLESLRMGECIGLQVLASPEFCLNKTTLLRWLFSVLVVSFLFGTPFREHQKDPSWAPLGTASFRRIGTCKKEPILSVLYTLEKKNMEPKKWSFEKLGGSFSIGWYFFLGSSR